MRISDIMRVFLLTGLIGASAIGVGCVSEGTTSFGSGDDGLPASTGAEVRRQVLASVADNVILPALQRFDESSTLLSVAASDWAASPADAEVRGALVSAYEAAMDDWQYLEVLQVGPAGLMSAVAGGEGVRDEVYAWPLVNRCRIDQETLEPAHASEELLAAEPVNVRGLGALEYLIFHPGDANACAPNSAINTEGTWNALTQEERLGRRAVYASVAAGLIEDQAERLSTMWSTAGGDFRSEFVRAGDTSTTYSSVQEALNALSDAMFYLEKETKDMKLATPLGLVSCSTATCPEQLEAALSMRSGRNVVVNLQAFVDIYRGGPSSGDSFGFDDLLDAAGQTELRADMDQLIAEAELAVGAVATDMERLLVDEPAVVLEAHDRLKMMLDVFKTQFIGVLDLDLPQRAEGDND